MNCSRQNAGSIFLFIHKETTLPLQLTKIINYTKIIKTKDMNKDINA